MDDFKEKYKVKQNNPQGSNVINFSEEKLKREGYRSSIPVKHYASIEDAEREAMLERNRQRRAQEARKQRLYAPKGSAVNAKRRSKKKNRRNLRIAAAVLSVALVGGVVGYVASQNQQEDTKNLEQLIEENADMNRLSLSQESIDTLLKYNEFFEDKENLSTVDIQEIQDMIKEIYDLDLRMVKEKMAPILGCDVSHIGVFYGSNEEDGNKFSTVNVYENPYDPNIWQKPLVSYNNAGVNLFSIPNENTLPEETCDIIWNLENLNSLSSNVQNRKISVNKALKELEKYFEELQTFGSKELIRGENGRLALVTYSEEIQTQKMQEDEERE